jgi:hypothetical protein
MGRGCAGLRPILEGTVARAETLEGGEVEEAAADDSSAAFPGGPADRRSTARRRPELGTRGDCSSCVMGREATGRIVSGKKNRTGKLCNGWQRWVISTQLHE